MVKRLDGLGRVVTVILVGVLIFMLPLRNLIMNYQNHIENHVNEYTKEFANKVMDQGYLTIGMYEEYLACINSSSDIYEVELIHSVNKEGQFIGEVEPHSSELLTEVKTTTPSNIELLSTSAYSSPLRLVSANDQSINTSVEHTKTCNNDHVYELDDYNNDLPCPICRETIAGIEVSIINDIIEQYEDIKAYITIIFLDGHTQVIEEGFSHNLDSSVLGTREVTFYYETADDKSPAEDTETVTVVSNNICEYCDKVYFSDSEENHGCDICIKKVIEINVDSDFYIISEGETLEAEVTALYANNEKEKVIGWTSNFNPNKQGLQNVMVFYENVMTSTKVYVESENDLACPNCNSIYSKLEYLECPMCSNIIVGIEIDLSNGTSIKLGSQIKFSLVLIYYDGQREIAKEGYEVIGYNPHKLGVQNITVKYNDHEVNQLIEVVEHINTRVCSEGHDYFLELDGSDSGCPLCTNVNLDKELTKTFTDINYTADIFKIIYSKGIYYFNEGDCFTVQVIMNSSRFTTNLIQTMLLADNKFKYTYGGIIHGKFF